jgi:tight adherence protein B
VFPFVTFLIFAAALYAVAHYVWVVPRQQQAQVVRARLRTLRASLRGRTGGEAPELLRREQRGSFAVIGDFVAWMGVFRRLQELISQANLKYRAADVAGVGLLIALVSYVLFGFLGMSLFLVRLLAAVVGGMLPVAYVMHMRTRRMKRFEEMLPDAIDLFTRTMRAGHNIHSGLETIADETADPVRMEFRKVMEELSLGSQVEPALHNLGQRVPLIDLKFFITGLILQRQTGANMVEVLENLSTLVRERLNMAAKLKAHTAQQRFSAGLLCLLPIVVGLGFYILKPDYIRLLWTDPVGTKFFTYAIISEIVGILIIRKLANIRV